MDVLFFRGNVPATCFEFVLEELRDIRWGWGGGGWGDVNVPWKRYVTYAGVGVGVGG